MPRDSVRPCLREHSFGFIIQTLARRTHKRMDAKLKEIDLDIKLFANLMLLSTKDGVSQHSLSKSLDFPDYSTSRHIDALVRAGYATRREDPDNRRVSLVFLTPEGRAKAALLPPIIEEVNASFLDVISPLERRALMQSLRKVAHFE